MTTSLQNLLTALKAKKGEILERQERTPRTEPLPEPFANSISPLMGLKEKITPPTPLTDEEFKEKAQNQIVVLIDHADKRSVDLTEA